MQLLKTNKVCGHSTLNTPDLIRKLTKFVLIFKKYNTIKNQFGKLIIFMFPQQGFLNKEYWQES